MRKVMLSGTAAALGVAVVLGASRRETKATAAARLSNAPAAGRNPVCSIVL